MTLRADFPVLQDAADRINQASSFMNTELANLRTTVSSVFDTGGEGTSWSGEAQMAYSTRQAEWDDAAGQLNLILTQLKNAVQAAKDDLQATEHRIRGTFE
jgi:6 kDa early secretory antigenic target